MNNNKPGVLLINLGTPDSSEPKAVYTYLKQFLNDPRIIDLPAPIRYILVNALIIPFRYKKSAHAYQQIWTEKGSPLLVHSNALITAIKKECESHFQIELGMRYGNPSIADAMHRLKDCQKIIVIPLFPQYASATSGSAIEAFLKMIMKQWNIPEITIKKDFFDHADFIKAWAAVIKENVASTKFDTLLFSYHGVPERHIDKSGCQAVCSRKDACPKNTACYRAQCYETSRLIAEELGLSSTEYQVSFQSRLGRTPWIKPYTDEVLIELRDKKIENIAIACPSFVTDCLETLEEINIRARAQWLDLGGTSFTFIPCLNEHLLWVNALTKLIKELAQ